LVSKAYIATHNTKKDQAKVLFRDAVAMVQQSPALAERLVMSGGVEKTNIAYLAKGSFFRPISTEDRGRGQSGPRPHCGLLDEIHEHPTNAMVEFMRAGTKGRRQALIFMITNSGSDRESVCYDYHDYGVKVCSGDIEDDSFFAFICSLDEEDDPFHDPSCWIKANPSLGITFQPKYLEEQVRQALGMPSKQNLVLRLNFCRWTDAESAWIGRDQWLACERPLDRSDFDGRECYGGLDLSGRRDLTAYAEVFPSEDGSLDAFVEFWTPKDTLKEREDQDRAPYQQWERAGHLHAVPGKVIDYAHVVERLGERSAKVEISAIAYDRWRIENLKADADAAGLDLNLVECGQGFKDMSPAVEAMEEAILNGTLRVHVNPVLRWNVASAVLEEDAAGNRKFTKRKATGRIDGLVALAMAVRLAVLNSAKPVVIEYERGQMFV
jgi:phage terminase large subunit-like protein